jgi:hypothetical protein
MIRIGFYGTSNHRRSATQSFEFILEYIRQCEVHLGTNGGQEGGLTARDLCIEVFATLRSSQTGWFLNV